ncbi:hypothetical protein H9L21_07250 [Aeromicrobium senzhongii]|uniref:Uncharacterized protein n=1 Tax=Aeromicrobium senzhongii TaxID=2663859 RepID=A0ABX6SWR7_9ACTN|nr:hypothetical protein [Aeromicrobium senzhongii]MTB87238.1 hypothetical protein [Aeromicrobium senzhongii]QNL95692.1 hypothetical protein H9L21_07250 [Aeromicrobium senzhongii]
MPENVSDGTDEPIDGQESGPGRPGLPNEDESRANETAPELVEVLPNVVAVFGELPEELENSLERLNTGLLSTRDHTHIASVVAAAGTAATVGGNLAQGAASMQGLYRLSEESRALLNAGGRLAVKDGKNLGTILLPKGSTKTLAQARFTPAAGVSVAQTAVALGPALAMVALQTQLNEVSALVRRNIDLTQSVIESNRRDERARLMSLIESVDQALEAAQIAGSVPASLWDTIASKKTDIGTERNKYRSSIEDHLRKITELNVRQRREFLQSNAQTIAFDAFALLAAVKAWTGFQALAGAVAREAGATDPAEAKHFESIVENTQRELTSDLDDIATLLGSLTRELRIIVAMPGPSSLKLSSKRKDIDTTRKLASSVLEAIAPLGDTFLAPSAPLERPEVVCAPPDVVLEPYWELLRWLLEPDEQLRAIGLAAENPAHGRVGAVVSAAKEKIGSTLDKDPNRVMVAVTDRRILTGGTTEFFKEAVFQDDTRLDEVRYVRAIAGEGESQESRIDLITRVKNHEWFFSPQIGTPDLEAFAAILAQSMMLPESERLQFAVRDEAPDRSIAASDGLDG